MNFSKFFIQRPIFAAVLSLIILIAGAISLFQLPISEYPEVVPPTVVVRASFPGANPKVIGETVAARSKQAITGVEGMLYMSSQATADGKLTLTITFALGTDLDNAQVQVQNRVTRTQPTSCRGGAALGVTVDKASPDLTMVVHLTSPDERYDMLYLSNYAALNVKDELARLDGVGDVQLFGMGDYSLRVWLDPNKVASRNLTATDVVTRSASRTVRSPPVRWVRHPRRARRTSSCRSTPGPAGQRGRVREHHHSRRRQTVRSLACKDVARIELGSSQYALRSLARQPARRGHPVFQRPGSNAIDISDSVRSKHGRAEEGLPGRRGLRNRLRPDHLCSRLHRGGGAHPASKRLILVVLVVILFLQTWRASIIPLAAVPVSLIGTFAVMHLLGFSLNALSLFGLVLAIGIVVDDAIVVVENVERNIGLGLTPFPATEAGHERVTGPIIATALVLCAVFIPRPSSGP
jgi:multidrug efflux pump